MAEQQLNIAEKVWVIKLLGTGERTTRQVAQEFNNIHPDRNISHSTVFRIKKLFEETGSVSRRKENNRVRNNAYERIMRHFRENPETSIRKSSLVLNIDKSQIWRCLKKHKMVPFKPRLLHTLEEGDSQRRMEYCLWLQANFLNDRSFIKNILFTDEATFTTNGTVSANNNRFWANEHENPHWVINCKRQYSQKINVWCGILNDRLIGPFFFNENLNGHLFLQFLQNELWEVLHNFPLQVRRNLYIQLDGAPIHNAVPVRNWLNTYFPNRWIGRNSPLIGWPPRTPDLSPLDFFLWGTLKEKVYRDRPSTVNQLINGVTAACRTITREQLRKVVEHNRKRVEKCILVNGELIEATPI